MMKQGSVSMELGSKVMKLLLYCVLAIGSVYFGGKLLAASTVSSVEEPVEIEKRSSAAIKKFIKDYQDSRFSYISNGNFFNVPVPYRADFGIWVTAKTQETIQSGRALALTFIKDYLAELQNNKDTSKWHQYLCEDEPKWYSGKPSLNNIGVRIAFWDENVERPKTPYLSEIDFYQDTFRYYESDPKTQALKLVLKESYEEAAKNNEKSE